MSWSLFVLFLLACVSLQLFLPHVWRVFVFTDFFMVLVFQAGRLSSPRTAVWFGWVAGFAQDVLMLAAYPAGLQSCSKMVVGFLSSKAGRTTSLNMDHPFAQSLFILLFSLFNGAFILGVFAVFGQTCPVQSFLPLFFGATCNALLNFPISLLPLRGKYVEEA